MTDLFSKIKEVTEIPAISGHEAPVRDYLRQQLTPHVDEIVTDGLGGIFGVKHSTATDAPRILVAAHMDEVGFMISEIKADGTFRVVPIGGWNPMVVSSQRFKLFTRDGREYPAISGSVPPHLTRGTGGPTVPAISDIVFDAGFASKAESEKYAKRHCCVCKSNGASPLVLNQAYCSGGSSRPSNGLFKYRLSILVTNEFSWVCVCNKLRVVIRKWI